jgi:hypothetical protein
MDPSAKVGAPGGKVPTPPKDLVPDRYNSRTELRAEVNAGGPNVFDFSIDRK